MKLKILQEARARYRKQSAWWREHRDAKTLFAEEFLAALRHLRIAPETGALYALKRGAVDPALAHAEDGVPRVLPV